MPGSDPSAGVIVIGGHLDSWDLGTGAIDDAAGAAITTAAAHRIMQAGQPRRTIRVVLFGAEEVGGGGGETHFNLHRGENNVVLVGESDFGADRVWRAQFSLGAGNAALSERIAAVLAPLGITKGPGSASAGADLGMWARAGTAAIDLNQDGTRYFDYHHTPDDTLDSSQSGIFLFGIGFYNLTNHTNALRVSQYVGLPTYRGLIETLNARQAQFSFQWEF